MNWTHHWICRSGYWKRTIANEVLRWVLEGVDLGADVLEIGPGYGAATDVLGARGGRLTCVELESGLALPLSRRVAGTNVRVVQADAVRLPFADKSFSAALCFTVLHHIPGPLLQDRLLAEVARVLRREGTFAGTDSHAGLLFRTVHTGDVCAPVDPQEFPHKLRSAGFTEISVDQRARDFRFRARRSPLS